MGTKWPPEAVFLEVRILMQKRVSGEFRGVGKSWQELARAAVLGGGVPLKQPKS